MLVKNILAIFAITGLAAAAPAEEFEARDLEERKDWYCQGETLCCSLVLGKSIGVFCKSSEWDQRDNKCWQGSPICCSKGIHVDFLGNQICVQ